MTPKTLKSLPTFLTTTFLFASPVIAETDPMPIGEYLESMDRTKVTFSGRIKYDSSDNEFTFYDDNRDPFGVTVDAGRDKREQIETDCENSSFLVTYSELCSISGSGTVEIRGSRVFISIEEVNQIIK